MTTIDRHLTDSELLRVLDADERTDGQGQPGRRTAAQTGAPDQAAAAAPDRTFAESRDHAARCHRCAEALDALRAESALVTDWLERAAFEEAEPGAAGAAAMEPGAGVTPARHQEPDAEVDRPTREASETGIDRASRGTLAPRSARAWLPDARWLQAAAVLLLVAAPLVAFPGVRGWVADRLVSTTTTESVTPDPDDAVTLRFTPAPGGFEVRFPAGTSGLLVLESAAGEEAELRAVGGTPETVVTASSLEIRNDDAARYELRLPLTVTGLWVRVGERAVAVSDTQIGRGTVIELGR
jgi:hypothetical protein